MTYNPAVMSARLEPADSLEFFPTPPWAVRAAKKAAREAEKAARKAAKGG
jgi:hypothetical protein